MPSRLAGIEAELARDSNPTFMRVAFPSHRRIAADVKPKLVRLFIKPYCGWCHKAMRWLNDRKTDYVTIDVTADESAMAEMVRLSGGEVVPVIDVDGKILADFGPEELAVFWERIEKENGRA